MSSFLYITEYPAGSHAGIQAPVTPGGPVAVQPRIDFSDAQVHWSNPFTGDTRMIEVTCDAVCSVRVGGTQAGGLTATTSDSRYFIGRVSFYVVKPGEQLAVIANT